MKSGVGSSTNITFSQLKFFEILTEEFIKNSKAQRLSSPRVTGAPGFRPENRYATAAKLIGKALVSAHDWGSKRRETSAIQAQSFINQTEMAMPTGGGVLIELQYHQWRCADVQGNKMPEFRHAYVCGGGRNSVEALKIYLSTDRMTEGAASGWEIICKYMWVVLK